MKKAKTRQPLGLVAYWHHIGTDNMLLVIDEVGTSLGYMRALAYTSSSKPSYGMAKKIIAAANKVTPGWAPDLTLMMEGCSRPPSKIGGKLMPSAEFLASQAAQAVAA